MEVKISDIASNECQVALEKLPAVGVEPTLLAERDFESRASANSATPATAKESNEM